MENLDYQTTSLQIQGMSCASCVARIEKRLRGLNGVKEASVNLATEKAAILYDPKVIKERDLVLAIEDLGYHVPEISEKKEKLTISVGGITCAACVNRIEKALGKMSGVTEAHVNLATEKATVLFRPDLIGKSEFKKTIEELGYEVRGFEEGGLSDREGKPE